MFRQQEKIDALVAHLEKLMDIKYQINKETDYCNHSYVVTNLLPEYRASKTIFAEALKELLDNNYDL